MLRLPLLAPLSGRRPFWGGFVWVSFRWVFGFLEFFVFLFPEDVGVFFFCEFFFEGLFPGVFGSFMDFLKRNNEASDLL